MKTIFTDEYHYIIDQLIEARAKAGRTQFNIANFLDKPQSFVSKYERKERRLDVIEFLSICVYLDVDPLPLVRELASEIKNRVSDIGGIQ